jgi:putative two-component system response regulator
MVAISDSILNKPGPLTAEEFNIMRTHSQIGSGTLANLHTQYPNNFFVKLGIQITQSHHARWDGNGYPDGMKERAIPLSARIMAIADVYDALVSKRPYKPAFPHQRAIEIIKEESGTHFDPEADSLVEELNKLDGIKAKLVEV